MTKDELKKILDDHLEWLKDPEKGKRADLSYKDLSSADLSSADLRSADLRSADLQSANLYSANLSSANLSSANLRSANLRSANLSLADLRSANLYSANLSSANLSSADLYSANLSSANLSSANLSLADLRSANLRSANLRSANLSLADLYSADLQSANLRSADLQSANLRSAKCIVKEQTTSLYGMLDQEGPITAYKLVNDTNEGVYNGGLKYIIGESIKVDNAETDETVQCGKGINVATLDWCLNEYKEGYKILKVQFKAEDVAAIPIGSDGKFRLHRCKVIGEKEIPKEEPEAKESTNTESEG